jgi:hypothetical protein
MARQGSFTRRNSLPNAVAGNRQGKFRRPLLPAQSLRAIVRPFETAALGPPQDEANIWDKIQNNPHPEEAAKQLSRRTHRADPPDLQFFHTRSASPSDGTIAHMIRVDFGPGMANLHAALAVICECVSGTGPATMIAHSASVRSLPQRKCFRLIAGAAAAQAQERNRKARGSRSDLLAILDRMSPLPGTVSV